MQIHMTWMEKVERDREKGLFDLNHVHDLLTRIQSRLKCEYSLKLCFSLENLNSMFCVAVIPWLDALFVREHQLKLDREINLLLCIYHFNYKIKIKAIVTMRKLLTFCTRCAWIIQRISAIAFDAIAFNWT